jgi:hypothetical protein
MKVRLFLDEDVHVVLASRDDSGSPSAGPPALYEDTSGFHTLRKPRPS